MTNAIKWKKQTSKNINMVEWYLLYYSYHCTIVNAVTCNLKVKLPTLKVTMDNIWTGFWMNETFWHIKI